MGKITKMFFIFTLMIVLLSSTAKTSTVRQYELVDVLQTSWLASKSLSGLK